MEKIEKKIRGLCIFFDPEFEFQRFDSLKGRNFRKISAGAKKLEPDDQLLKNFVCPL